MNGPAILLDTETTDKDDEREIIEAAWIRPIEVGDLAGPSDRIPRPIIPEAIEAPNADGLAFVQRYKPSRPIGLGAMAVHHILPSELEDCPPSSEFALPTCLYIVGHNIDFDWQAAGSPPGVKRICTDAMARYVWPDAESYSQSALLYYLLGPTPETRAMLLNAHSALIDVENCAVLLEKILDERPEISTWSQLHEYSEACRIPRVMPIGEKQGVKGMTLDEAVEYDLGFVNWCLRQDWIDDYLRKGLEQAIERVNAKWTGVPA